MSQNKPWFIVGRGSIGLLAAHQLVSHGYPVELIVKSNTLQANSSVFDVTAIDGSQSQCRVNIQTFHQLAGKTIDYLLVPLKAYDILPAIRQIKPYIQPNTVIILCHNGMGTIEEVQQELGFAQPLLFATTTHGAYRSNSQHSPQHLVHSGLGQSKIGWISKPVTDDRQLRQSINHLLPPISWHDDINVVLWQKLAINCVINPLSAMAQCQNGALDAPRFSAQIYRLCQEIAHVANACQLPFTTAELIDSCYQVIKATANNFSSMNRDVAAGRTTEIDYINGYLVRQAQLVGIKVPENLALYQQIKAL
ncbi:MAG: 2-dehydropantoate 2-reductase [Phenylobacterium sp.]|jgi:2-dehydropantoate 2-reductase